MLKNKALAVLVLVAAGVSCVALRRSVVVRDGDNSIVIPDVMYRDKAAKRYVGPGLLDGSELHGAGDPLGMGDISGRDEDVAARLARVPVADITAKLSEEGWVNDDLQSQGASAREVKPFLTNEAREVLARLNNSADAAAATVDDGIRRELNLTEMDPKAPDGLEGALTKYKSTQSDFPSQYDPVTPVGVKYSNGDIRKNERLLFTNKGGIVESDPLKLSEPPMELALPPRSAYTRDIRVPTRGEDNDLIGERTRGWDDIISRGNLDTRETRVFDPTIPEEKLVIPASSAVGDMPDEIANLEPANPPFEETPKRLSRSPIRGGMERVIK